MVLSFCGCSANNYDATDLETKYYEYAQECIEKGDTETAIKALEEGVEKTGSEKLKELLNTLKDENKEESQNGSVTDNSSQSSENPSSSQKPADTNSSSKPETSSENNSSEAEPVADICGFYSDGYTNYTVYKKNGSYKVFIESSGCGGYFALKSKGSNSYSVAYNGTDYAGGG